MPRTERYRDEHQDLLGLADDLEDLLVPSELLHDGVPARAALSVLHGHLALHLGTEDNVLYPELFAHPDGAVQAAARAAAREGDALRAAFAAFVRRWPSPGSIEERPAAFADEARIAVGALRCLVRAEDEGLYPLADGVSPGPGRVVPLRPGPGSGRLRGAG